MIRFTLRLDNEIYSELVKLSEIISVPYSSIIKFQLHEFINRDITTITELNINKNDTIATTIRYSNEFHDKIKLKSEQLEMSLNTFINSACRYELDLWNSEKQ